MIHCYQLGGYNIVLDVCSGAVHAVDELAYDMIQQYEALDREELLRRMNCRTVMSRLQLSKMEGSCLPPMFLNRWQGNSRRKAAM